MVVSDTKKVTNACKKTVKSYIVRVSTQYILKEQLDAGCCTPSFFPKGRCLLYLHEFSILQPLRSMICVPKWICLVKLCASFIAAQQHYKHYRKQLKEDIKSDFSIPAFFFQLIHLQSVMLELLLVLLFANYFCNLQLFSAIDLPVNHCLKRKTAFQTQFEVQK